uniref:NADH-ubiquinone oxidoreductase chain 4L n=1 Tax=Danionella mirifica TaxID=487619 RepID=F3Y704_9TELE|nr:NADH dehydrogenase subunit 4L [Danionella mirifica]
MSSLVFTSTSFSLMLFGLVNFRTHLMSALLCLEGMMLTLFISSALWSAHVEDMTSSPVPLYILSFTACGAASGLALLVATARTHGTDNLMNFNLLQC